MSATFPLSTAWEADKDVDLWSVVSRLFPEVEAYVSESIGYSGTRWLKLETIDGVFRGSSFDELERSYSRYSSRAREATLLINSAGSSGEWYQVDLKMRVSDFGNSIVSYSAEFPKPGMASALLDSLRVAGRNFDAPAPFEPAGVSVTIADDGVSERQAVPADQSDPSAGWWRRTWRDHAAGLGVTIVGGVVVLIVGGVLLANGILV